MVLIQNGKILSLTIVSGLLLAVFPLAACTLETPTAFSQKRVEVLEKSYHSEMETSAVDDIVLRAVADNFRDRGQGSLTIMVTYNPSGTGGNTAMKASENAARFARSLGRYGVLDVATEIMPVTESGMSWTHIDFNGYAAQAPEGCRAFEDIEDRVEDGYADYALGCSTETYIARQVARPADLLGQSDMDDADGRRLGNSVAGGYRSGEPNAPLEGELASDN